MGKQEKEPTQSPVYETILPEWRFKELAKIIFLDHVDEVDQRTNVVEMTLPNPQQGDSYKLQWRQDFNPWFGGALSTYVLERYTTGTTSKQPKTRYLVGETPDGKVYPLKVFNIRGQEERYDKAEKRAAAAEVLRILSAVAPEKAKSTLDIATDHQYAIAIGSYILSDMALEDAENNLDVDAVWQAIEVYEQRSANIEKVALKKAERQHSEKHPQPYYYEAVQEAVETRPVPDHSNRYAALDILGSADAVAENMQRKWSNIIPAESISKSAEPFITPEPVSIVEPESDQDV